MGITPAAVAARKSTKKRVPPDSSCSTTSNCSASSTTAVDASHSPTRTATHASPPFPIATTLTFQALHHWAQEDPHRTALIYSEKEWKVDHGTLVGSSSKSRDLHQQQQPHYRYKHVNKDAGTAPLVSDASQWKLMTYGELYDRVQRLRIALHKAGIPLPNSSSSAGDNAGYRVLILFLPPSRADLLALVLALQAAGCVLLFGTPDAFGGLRSFFRAMLELEPDGVLCSRVGYALFRSLAMTIGSNSTSRNNNKRRKGRGHATWIQASQLLTSLQQTDANCINTCNTKDKKHKALRQPVMPDLPLDTVTSIMFSGGTTGDPTPIEVTHRMLCSQAANYAGMLQLHLGAGILSNASTSKITGTFHSNDTGVVVSSQRHGPWTSAHIFLNFVMLDLVLGGTAVLQPMGLSSPEDRVCAATFTEIIHHFQAVVTSAPPALWTRIAAHGTSKQQLACVKVACLGGAETSATFAKQVTQQALSCKTSRHNSNNQQLASCEFYRVYGTTQVLPIAMALGTQVVHEEKQHCTCAKGGGVCLGTPVEGLNVVIDSATWERQGGRSQLEWRRSGTAGAHCQQPQQDCWELGELCVYGTALSPSCEPAVLQPPGKLTLRKFATGDICYMDPDSHHIHFLGRKAQAVDCGPRLKLVPPVGVEMVCLETQAIARCAFVGIPPRKRHERVIPVVVVQFHGDDDGDGGSTKNCNGKELLKVAKEKIRAALAKSVWSELLEVGLKCAVYPKAWPVDSRHSSKINRHLLRDWAAKLDSHKLQPV